MKQRRHQGKYEFSAYDTNAGQCSARKIPKKQHWHWNASVTLDDLIGNDWLGDTQTMIFEPSG